MLTEVQRRRQGRIAARRCWNESRIAVDEETRDALERAAVRYMLKALGLNPEDEICGAPGEIDAPLLRWDAHDQGSQERAMRGGDTARW